MQRAVHSAPTQQTRSRAWQAVAFVGLSLVLYSRVIGIGLLSDDFVLLEQARHSELINRSWGFVRPLPLAIWWMIDRLAPTDLTAAALHAFNVALHGVNAWLVVVVAARFGIPRRAAAISGLLFLAWPFNVEAVTWAAGIFDICVTTFALSAVLIAADAAKSRPARLALVSVLTAAAIASKETGIAMPALLLLTAAFVGGAERKSVAWCAVAAGLVVAVYIAARLVFAPPPDLFTDAVLIKNKLLTRPFGALGLGIHRDLMQLSPAIGITLAVGRTIGPCGAPMEH